MKQINQFIHTAFVSYKSGHAFLTRGQFISVCLYLAARQAKITDINFHTFGPRFSRPSSLSNAGNRSVCDGLQAGRCTVYMSIPPEPSTVKDCRNILNAKFPVW